MEGGGRKGMFESEHEERAGQMVMTSNGVTSNGVTSNGVTSNGVTSNGVTNWENDDDKQRCDKPGFAENSTE